ncbi:DNA-directed RNA polymerase specialized sigma24 family protein [Actinocorallia herbida]|uniref:DNA-directed RNA polymerase specialized sigma24 family protein n=1 Tax=Actinocorallia herbida TaxID=58109 RepID=A0A3N1DA35_9ACTN|nr:zf-HC2 domain-containing protein [Actinocorallia herbida]ROO90387.1 DNA-directed RNA polymerase specialized sigma24 family protein [Actinocorallia herbida]
MDDRLLVEALRARDPGALASVYDAYAARLYAYCWFRLADAEAAQVALRDTFIVAEAHADRLQDSGAFLPWLFALARAECARRPEAAEPQPDPPVGDPDQPDTDQKMLAWRAVQALDPLPREALELEARHRLPASHVALVLDQPERQTLEVLADAKGDLRRALTVEILSRLGPVGCSGRADLLAARVAGELDANVRANLLAHVKACPECAGHRPTDAISPTKIFAMVPCAAPPASLRAKVMGCFTDPDLVGYRLFVATRSTDFNALGFPGCAAPEPVEEEPSRRGWWRKVLVVGVLSGGLVAGTTFVGWMVGDPRHEVRTIASGGSPTSRPTPSETVDDRPRPPVPRHGLLSATFPAGAYGSATPEPIATPQAVPPVPTPQSVGQGGVAPEPGGPGRLKVWPLRLHIGSGSDGELKLEADDDLVWRAKVKGPIKLSEPSGELTKDERATVKVKVLRSAKAGKGVIRFGGVTVKVTWDAATTAQSPSLTPSVPSPEGPLPQVPLPIEPTASPAPTAVVPPDGDGSPAGGPAPEVSPSDCPPEEADDHGDKDDDGDKGGKFGSWTAPTSLSFGVG